MKKTLYILLLFSFATGTFVAGSWYNQHKASVNTSASARKVLYYIDPMHPAYKSDKPGTAPDCGMQLVPVYADSRLASVGLGSVASSLLEGAVQIDAVKQQLFGVRVEPVEKNSGAYNIRLFGRVVPDEA
ncbi:MAG TPA: heavy metal-binding domain-containing protein, partial [Blattabacteriaceae bacterium]|nr:heavy metal-binding domain-containing protein [Blattabacteriaceae bacterium]